MSCRPTFIAGDGDTHRETTTEAAGLRDKLGQEDCGSDEGGSKRMDELREIGVQMSLTVRLVKCQLKWAGHLVQMGERENGKVSR